MLLNGLFSLGFLILDHIFQEFYVTFTLVTPVASTCITLEGFCTVAAPERTLVLLNEVYLLLHTDQFVILLILKAFNTDNPLGYLILSLLYLFTHPLHCLHDGTLFIQCLSPHLTLSSLYVLDLSLQPCGQLFSHLGNPSLQLGFHIQERELEITHFD